jgi:hypothetical protein
MLGLVSGLMPLWHSAIWCPVTLQAVINPGGMLHRKVYIDLQWIQNDTNHTSTAYVFVAVRTSDSKYVISNSKCLSLLQNYKYNSIKLLEISVKINGCIVKEYVGKNFVVSTMHLGIAFTVSQSDLKVISI